jgi:hypothetical protein
MIEFVHLELMKGSVVPKKLLIWLVIAFAAFYLFTQPEGAAHAVGGAFSAVGDAFGSVITFLSTLFNL